MTPPPTYEDREPARTVLRGAPGEDRDVLWIPSSSALLSGARDRSAAESSSGVPDPEGLTRTVLHSGTVSRPSTYVLKQYLGRGAFSAVYAAANEATHEAHAVKLLDREADDFVRQLFVRESKLICSLEISGVIRGVARGLLGERPYVISPMVSGFLQEELTAHRERNTLPNLEEIFEFLLGVLAPLDRLHGIGITHRDLKPANLALVSGKVLILDLGVAHDARDPADPFNDLVVGTPEYMAPEQLDGKASPRSDLFAIGVILYEMLTGTTPWPGTNLEARARDRARPAPDVRERAEGVPDLVAALTRALLAPDPARRPESAGRLRKDLLHIRLTLQKKQFLAAGAPPALEGEATTLPAKRPEEPLVVSHSHGFDPYLLASRISLALSLLIGLFEPWLMLFAALPALAGLRYIVAQRGPLRIDTRGLSFYCPEVTDRIEAPWHTLQSVDFDHDQDRLTLTIQLPSGREITQHFRNLGLPLTGLVQQLKTTAYELGLTAIRFNGRTRSEIESLARPRSLPRGPRQEKALALPEAPAATTCIRRARE